MIRGVTVTVLVPQDGGDDRFGNPVKGQPLEEAVDDVLVHGTQASATGDFAASRPEGDEFAMTLHFPKGYSRNLRGCEVVLPEPWGGIWRVEGESLPYIDANTPTRWHMPIKAVLSHG